jgi:alkanesulfonate monooxygenase SsuD/methylene tetrahydromethanopterin reductase-like flavin-dependent oxidoreductase (luciferase family)
MGTEWIGIGTNLIPAHHARHLHLLAATVAAVDEISQGRLMIGIGASTRWPSYPANARPLKMMRDAILGLRALLAGQEYDLDGQDLSSSSWMGHFAGIYYPRSGHACQSILAHAVRK